MYQRPTRFLMTSLSRRTTYGFTPCRRYASARTQRISDLRRLHPFRRHSRSKSDVVQNRAESWTLLPSQILGVQAPKKLYPNYHACPAARHVQKIRQVTAPSPKVIGAHTLNFKPIFEFISLKNCWGTPVRGKCELASLGHSVPHVKI